MAAPKTGTHVPELHTEQLPSYYQNQTLSPEEAESISSESVSESLPDVDEGRIELNTDSRLFKTLSKICTQYRNQKDLSHAGEPPAYSKRPPFHLRLNICIQVIGSRGDVQPFVALGVELMRHGHRVRLATHDVFEGFVRDAGLEFFPAGGDPAELMAYMVKNPGLIPSMKSLHAGDVKKKRVMVGQMLEGFWRSCVAPDTVSGRPFVADAIIANPPSFAHIHCAEALGVPLHLMFTMPWSSNTAFPHPLVALNLKDKALQPNFANYVSYIAVSWLTWQGLGDVVNAWRHTLDLDPVPHSEGPMLQETLRIPFTYCWSAALVPKPDDWPSYIDVCGFFFRDEPQYTPDTELDAFLNRGPPPVYIGFGSIVIEDPTRLTRILLDAVREVGVRAVISRGWSNLGENEAPDDNILYLGDCPHEWLFKRVSAVVHHGGAGTTACGLLNERPTFIVPFFGDQPFWGEMVAAAGAGPSPVHHTKLNSRNLAEAITFCLSETAQSAASVMAAKMKTESGVQEAVDSFHANLPAEVMGCEIIPGQPAHWKFKKGHRRIRMSKVAAEILLHESEIRPNHLFRYESKPVDIYLRRWDIVTATASSLGDTAVNMALSTANIVVKPVEAIVEGSKARKAERLAKSAPTSEASSMQDGESSLYSLQEKHGLSRHHHHHTFAKAVQGSASGVGGFFHYFSKGMLVDLPVAATEGLRAFPKLYGSDVPEHGKVKDWKSGAIIAGKNFGYGITTGITDLVNEPVKGAKENGALGAVLGVGKGMANMTTKVGSGVLGLVAYPGQGLMKTIVATARGTTRRHIAQATRDEAADQLSRLEEMGIDSGLVVERFQAKMEEPTPHACNTPY